MGLIINLKNIESPNNFKLFYRVGRTPGSSSIQSDINWGTQYTGGTSIGGIFSGGTTTISIDLIDENIDLSPYSKQYWFKILDTVTGSYIIENIMIHDYEFYQDCIPDCVLEGNAQIYNLPTPTLTPTPTPTLDCVLVGDAVYYIAT